MEGTAVVLFGHGSRDEDGRRELYDLGQAVARAAEPLPVRMGVLEFAAPPLPDIQAAVDAAVAAGARRIIAQPVLLLNANHGKRDIPWHVAEARRRHPQVEVVARSALGPHPVLLEIVRDRVAAALAGLPPVPEEETGILLVGRGSYDPEANGDLHKIARLFWECTRFGWVEAAFVSLARPFVPDGLRRLAALGARRLVVIPYFINTGTLVKRIGAQAAAMRSELPGREVVVGAHMGVDPRLVQVLLDEIHGRPRPPFPPGRKEPVEGNHHHHHHHHHSHPHDHSHSHGADGHSHGHGPHGHSHGASSHPHPHHD